ncbi:MAG: orotate phosphoribosyltransferase [Clostridia bacterium]|nr:orotate phosphoribosyltransferase [Clostridia bacterium]
MTDREILEIFEKTGGLLKGHFLLTSGRHSDRYMQCAKLFMYPEYSEVLCAELAKKLSALDVDCVASPAIGGIIMGYAVAKHLNKKSIFAERENSEMCFRRGFGIAEGEKCIVVEDVVTTGGSVKEVISLIKEHGGEVVGVASIVDRSGGKIDFGVPFFSLLSMDITSYPAEDCPICKEGLPLVKPGSRKTFI